jgi:uncharacterized protein (DUF952 family)
MRRSGRGVLQISHPPGHGLPGKALARPGRDDIGGSVAATIYKICAAALWREAERARVFRGAGIDLHDGYIHFSSAGQVAETAAKHFAGAADLVLVAVDARALGAALRFEAARGGALFPHLYGELPLAAVRWVKPLPLGASGHHVVPELDP